MTRLLTMTVAVLTFLVGTVIGVRLLISGTEAAEPPATCTASVVAKGGRLTTNAVKVNVFNASNRSGLANRVTINLQANGFLGGAIGNSTSATKPSRVAILTSDKQDPRVRLVAAQFRDKVTYAENDIAGIDGGVVVVIGDDYSGLRKKATSAVKTDRAIKVCTPVVTIP